MNRLVTAVTKMSQLLLRCHVTTPPPFKGGAGGVVTHDDNGNNWPRSAGQKTHRLAAPDVNVTLGYFPTSWLEGAKAGECGTFPAYRPILRRRRISVPPTPR